MKVVVNRCYGGFGLSPSAEQYYLGLKGKKAYFYKQTKYSFREGVDEYTRHEQVVADPIVYTMTRDLGPVVNSLPGEDFWYSGNIERNDPDLVKTVEALGEDANGKFSELEIVEIPDGTEWEIEEYDGAEWIAEKHQTW